MTILPIYNLPSGTRSRSENCSALLGNQPMRSVAFLDWTNENSESDHVKTVKTERMMATIRCSQRITACRGTQASLIKTPTPTAIASNFHFCLAWNTCHYLDILCHCTGFVLLLLPHFTAHFKQHYTICQAVEAASSHWTACVTVLLLCDTWQKLTNCDKNVCQMTASHAWNAPDCTGCSVLLTTKDYICMELYYWSYIAC